MHIYIYMYIYIYIHMHGQPPLKTYLFNPDK